MHARVAFPKIVPEIHAAIRDLDALVQRSGLDKTLIELVKTRAPQINACAFCLDMHTKDARRHGETEQRLHGLPAWRETPYFTDRERAALVSSEIRGHAKAGRLEWRAPSPGQEMPTMRWPPTAMRLLPALTLFLWVATANAGPPVCSPDIVGSWTGVVWDAGQLKELRTQFSTGTGELTGAYHVEDDAGGYDGTLTDFVPSGFCAGTFHWHDRHGDGVVWVDFRPDRDRFDGEWGTGAPLRGYIFTGRRFRPVPVS
ncbi:MAG: carboxymuconolactone decarboxylase family protein [Acetobacteraceae bacterium]|nr:carboxymuconolactone decarboxylase family protein [Acetobacteraceae bacterium]